MRLLPLNFIFFILLFYSIPQYTRKRCVCWQPFMGFTIANYSLFGLQPQNFYVSIHGTFQIRKDQNCYVVIFTIYYHGAPGNPAIMKKEDCFSIEQLPEPANIYPMIYNEIKKTINPDNIPTYIIQDDQ